MIQICFADNSYPQSSGCLRRSFRWVKAFYTESMVLNLNRENEDGRNWRQKVRPMKTSSQASCYASLKLCPLNHWLTDLLTRVKCRATSVAKNVCSTATLKQRGTRWEEVWVSHLINTNKYFIFHNHTRYMYIHFIYMDISIISYPHTHHQMQKPLNCLAQFISTWRNLLWIIACIESRLPSSARSFK